MMTRKLKILLLSSLLVGLVLSLGGIVLISEAASSEPLQRKIVVFKSEKLSETAKETLINKFGGVKIKDLPLINGKGVLLSKKAEIALRQQSEVLRIDDDVEVFALAKPIKTKKIRKPQPPEVLPWGIDRIEAEKIWNITTGDPIKVAIIDTGIDLTHPDLKNNIKGGYNAIFPSRSAKDDNGHGTHVAGIVAALDNEIGVIGVGPKIDLYAVKVLNASGSGYLSDIIEGLEWVIKQKNIQGGDWVINMSLGTTSNIQSFHEAVKKVYEAGIVLVAAAGNTGGSVLYPAAYPEVIAVSAIDKNDTLASWSSRGPEVDLTAPGVDIYSTYKGSTYKTLEGTSMAAPHVTGVVALVLTQKEKCDFNQDNICSPEEIKQRLETTAQDLGVVGRDDLYGYGLVNAESALSR
ncbi:MAG: S8 family peptidase [Candidatus Paceibacterota bacterium]